MGDQVDDEAEKSTRWWSANMLGWIGVGLLTGALGLVVVNLPWQSEGGTGVEDPIGGHWPLAVMAALAALLALGYRFLSDPYGAERRVRWHFRIPLLLCSAGTAVMAVVDFPRDSFTATMESAADFDPSPGGFSVWLAVCLVSLGCLLLALGPHEPGLVGSRFHAPLGFCAGTLAVVVAGALIRTVVFPPLLHTVAEAADPVPEPATVTRAGWTWQPPPGTDMSGVFDGTRGPLMRVDDGLVALDGRTGNELWRYRLPFAERVTAGTVEGVAYVTHDKEGTEEQPDELRDRITVLLDPGTGEVLGEFTLSEEERREFTDWNADLRVRWDGEGERQTLSGWSVDGTDELWTHTLETVPGHACHAGATEMEGDWIVYARACFDLGGEPLTRGLLQDLAEEDGIEGTYTVFALDTADGQEVWRHEREVGPREDSLPDLGLPRPVGEGGDPVVYVDPLRSMNPPPYVLALADGSEVEASSEEVLEEALNEELMAEGMFEEGSGSAVSEILRVDTEDALLLSDIWADDTATLRVHGPRTAEVRDYSLNFSQRIFVRPLADAAVFPGLISHEWTGSHVLVVPFGESVTTREAVRVPVDLRTRGGAAYPRGELRLTTVPGAVVAHVEDGGTARGLVP